MHVYTANMLKETDRPVYIDLVALILVNQTFEVRIKRMMKLFELAIILSGTKVYYTSRFHNIPQDSIKKCL